MTHISLSSPSIYGAFVITQLFFSVVSMSNNPRLCNIMYSHEELLLVLNRAVDFTALICSIYGLSGELRENLLQQWACMYD